MLKKITLLFSILLFFSISSKANFEYNANCIKAYEAIFDLRLSDAENILKVEKQQHPNNGIVVLLENYIDFFKILISENMSDYNKLKDLKGVRLNKIAGNDASSPYYLYAQAEINLQWGMLKGRFQDYVSSALDIKKADNLLRQNEQKFSNFLPAKKSLALVEVIMGSVPSNLKGMLQTFGFKGDANKGVAMLQNLSVNISKTPYQFYRDEITFLLCYIETDLRPDLSNYQKTMNLLNNFNDGSLLKTYLQGYVSYRNGKNDTAIHYLSTVKNLKGNYVNFPKVNYVLGSAKLNRNDADAYVYLIKYLKEYDGINFVKDAYLKLAYFYLLRGDNEKYQSFLRLVKSQGNLIDEKDKQALLEANDSPANIDLLKARYSFDGGYFSKALSFIDDKSAASFNLLRDKIEIHYRLGRIYGELNKTNEAVINYQKAISLGSKSNYYFAANAALFAGYIYEKKNDKLKAANFFRIAVNMKNHQYENSIENKAKDGLKRIGYNN
jgi:hypothetical protein